MGKITVSKDEWRKIQRQLDKLSALENNGVDNWEWYGDALAEWNKENELDELAEEFLENMNDLTVDAEVDYPAGREAGHSITLPQEDVRELFVSFIGKYKEMMNDH